MKKPAQLIYGTGNQAKIDAMVNMVTPLNLEIVGIHHYLNSLPKIREEGKDPLENAVLKAKAYYKVLQKPVFSCDSGLFIEGLPKEKQPGTHVRRVKGRDLTDEEMIAYYAGIAKDMGSQCVARYCNAICLVINPDEIYFSMDEDLWGEKFILSPQIHTKREAGFPLDSISIHIKSGKYYYDMEENQGYNSPIKKGFLRFFERCFNG